MRKTITPLIFFMILTLYGFSTAGTIAETEELGPFSKKVTGWGWWKPAYVEVGEFEFDQILGNISSAYISGTWSGKLGMNQHVYLYLGDYGESPSTWIRVADLYNPISSWRWISNLFNPRRANYTNMIWQYTLNGSELASLAALLDDGILDLIIVGKPSKINQVSLGVTTFTIEDPIPAPIPEPTTLLLLGTGLLGLAGLSKRFKK